MTRTQVKTFLNPTPRTRSFFTWPVSAGLLEPDVEYIDGRIDLNRYLIKNSTSPYFVQLLQLDGCFG